MTLLRRLFGRCPAAPTMPTPPATAPRLCTVQMRTRMGSHSNVDDVSRHCGPPTHAAALGTAFDDREALWRDVEPAAALACLAQVYSYKARAAGLQEAPPMLLNIGLPDGREIIIAGDTIRGIAEATPC